MCGENTSVLYNKRMALSMTTPVQYVKGVGERRAEALAKKGILTVYDLLFTFPRKYRDFTNVKQMVHLSEGEEVVVRGRILKNMHGSRFGRVRHKMVVADNTSSVTAIWFQPLKGLDAYRPGEEVYICGRVIYRSGFTFTHPIIEPVRDETRRANRIVPVYSEIEGFGETLWINVLKEALAKYACEVSEILPAELVARHKFLSRRESLYEMHFPSDPEKLNSARKRFVYEEFFVIQVRSALWRKYYRAVTKRRTKTHTPHIESRIRARFPFEFTDAQNRVVKEIVADMESEFPMNRLLQGDVGSGKTAVALYAALLTVANKQQVAFLAPTDVLAQQHFATVSKFLDGSRVHIELLTGSLAASERERVKKALAAGEVNIVVGTHSLLTEDVAFADLGLAVIDEQHRFGVDQRSQLRKKGIALDTLVMTATPIPRTLSMTLFGDLDLSIIDELPPGRKPVRTLRYPLDAEYRAHALALESLKSGGQVFVVCPMIDGAEEGDDLHSAVSVYDRLREDVYSGWRVGLAHGRMSTAEREQVMDAFREGKLDVLVSTVIIEVGVDVPNASVMIIERAERFGLATLHQLRGRVGRGTRLSYCLCVADLKSDESRQRLDVFCSTNDGFKIAEEDLKMRGPGEILGTKQHGAPALRWGSLESDFDLLKLAHEDAFELVEKGYRPGDVFKAEIERLYGKSETRSTVG